MEPYIDYNELLHKAFTTPQLVFFLGVVPLVLVLLALMGKEKGGPVFLLGACAYIGAWSAKYGFACIIGHFIAYVILAAFIVLVGGICMYPAYSLLKQVFR